MPCRTKEDTAKTKEGTAKIKAATTRTKEVMGTSITQTAVKVKASTSPTIRAMATRKANTTISSSKLVAVNRHVPAVSVAYFACVLPASVAVRVARGHAWRLAGLISTKNDLNKDF